MLFLTSLLLTLIVTNCSLINGEQVSYLQLSSEEIDSAEYGLTNGTKGTTCACGFSNKNRARILGGKVASRNEFPFAAAIIDRYTQFIFCGGTLVTSSHVITGAHCTWRRRVVGDPIAVRLGEHITTEESSRRLTVDVSRIVEHEYFNRDTLVNDIALLVLKEKVNFNRFIAPVCLPIEKKDLGHQYVRVIGWGSVKKDGQYSPGLKKVDLRVIPLWICSYNYAGRVNAALDNQICTFGRRKGSCQGDSGGPVLWLDPEINRYTLIGTVSFGKGCASSVPNVNTLVFSYLGWITRVIKATSEQAICTKQN